MEYPTRQQYRTAIEHLDTFVDVPHLKGGKPKRTANNMLEAYSGGYCQVYPIEVGSRTIALRCWIADIGEEEERYQKIKRYLQKNPLSYFAEFDYFHEGILVNGKRYPVVTMEWINGKPLNEFLDAHIHNSSVVWQLAQNFELMVKKLHDKRISHGDLQEGNILVEKRGNSVNLKLIDYDSLFVPSLRGWRNEIMGVPTYQHPNRQQLKIANEKTDYFSELVIYLSLRAYTEKPTLWKKGQEKRLLFSETDFRNPSDSTVFRQLKSFSGDIKHLAEQLEYFCRKKNPNQLSPLERLIIPGVSPPPPPPIQQQPPPENEEQEQGAGILDEYFTGGKNTVSPSGKKNGTAKSGGTAPSAVLIFCFVMLGIFILILLSSN